MGDRGNIVIEKDGDCFTANVFFYTHWSGSSIKSTLQNALRRGRGRWDDPSYLARIIFSEMIQGDILAETGFGISTVIGDNGHDLLCVNIKKQEVIQRASPTENWKDDLQELRAVKKWSFEKYIEQDFE